MLERVGAAMMATFWRYRRWRRRSLKRFHQEATSGRLFLLVFVVQLTGGLPGVLAVSVIASAAFNAIHHGYFSCP